MFTATGWHYDGVPLPVIVSARCFKLWWWRGEYDGARPEFGGPHLSRQAADRAAVAWARHVIQTYLTKIS